MKSREGGVGIEESPLSRPGQLSRNTGMQKSAWVQVVVAGKRVWSQTQVDMDVGWVSRST